MKWIWPKIEWPLSSAHAPPSPSSPGGEGGYDPIRCKECRRPGTPHKIWMFKWESCHPAPGDKIAHLIRWRHFSARTSMSGVAGEVRWEYDDESPLSFPFHSHLQLVSLFMRKELLIILHSGRLLRETWKKPRPPLFAVSSCCRDNWAMMLLWCHWFRYLHHCGDDMVRHPCLVRMPFNKIRRVILKTKIDTIECSLVHVLIGYTKESLN